MNKEQLVLLIKNPENIATADTSMLSVTIRDYPYFHTAHLLLLYHLKKTENARYEAQLKESAIFVADRQLLFNLLNDFNIPQGVVFHSNPEEVKSNPESHIQESNGLLEIDENIVQNYPDTEVPRVVEFSSDDGKLDDRNNLHHDFELEDESDKRILIPEITTEPSAFDLVEKFIEENPAFVPNRLDLSESRQDISESSIIDTEDVVTETLAIVYTTQKLYDKAISVYEKLILNFPEKRAYFASRIEELRNNVN